MRVIVVVGARPNFIKVGPLMPALAAAGIHAHIAHTGQHYDSAMSDVFFADLDIPEPEWFLGVGSGTHAVQTGTAMMKLEELFSAERPDAVLVVGDVNSTLAAALAAVKVHVPVVHLEAGLRSRDMSMPEEVNRLVTDQLSALLLTPVTEADANLLAEGVDPARIVFVGNIMAESVLRNLPRIEGRDVCTRFGMAENDYLLVTVHRPENTDHPERLAEIAAALESAPLPVLFPVHPRTRPRLAAYGVGEASSRVRLTEPVGYLDMLALQRDAAAVLTDSGGVQEEACMVRTPCVTVRRNTERGITIDVGANELVSAERELIGVALERALAKHRDWSPPERWDELVASRVADALTDGIPPLAGYEGA
ncbi:MAG: UDP-N-acetylglucosamine 2-epimerase (non-hydrolyzing) [Anaerosomatales bacterium]|nr:UDP-N-acetylglucosamine 2-epimerase (non-hydrolyzing) [Anaerosomatales bacterium]